MIKAEEINLIYKTLEIEKFAILSKEQFNYSFRLACKKYHPDNAVTGNSEKLMKIIDVYKNYSFLFKDINTYDYNKEYIELFTDGNFIENFGSDDLREFNRQAEIHRKNMMKKDFGENYYDNERMSEKSNEELLKYASEYFKEESEIEEKKREEEAKRKSFEYYDYSLDPNDYVTVDTNNSNTNDSNNNESIINIIEANKLYNILFLPVNIIFIIYWLLKMILPMIGTGLLLIIYYAVSMFTSGYCLYFMVICLGKIFSLCDITRLNIIICISSLTVFTFLQMIFDKDGVLETSKKMFTIGIDIPFIVWFKN